MQRLRVALRQKVLESGLTFEQRQRKTASLSSKPPGTKKSTLNYLSQCIQATEVTVKRGIQAIPDKCAINGCENWPLQI